MNQNPNQTPDELGGVVVMVGLVSLGPGSGWWVRSGFATRNLSHVWGTLESLTFILSKSKIVYLIFIVRVLIINAINLCVLPELHASEVKLGFMAPAVLLTPTLCLIIVGSSSSFDNNLCTTFLQHHCLKLMLL